MTLSEVLIVAAVAVLAYVTAIWLLSLVLRNAGIIDIFWGFGITLLAALYFVLTDGYLGRKVLVLTLAGIWGLRLSGYLLWRSWGKGEDFRYRQWREAAGEKFWWTSYFRVFLFQGSGFWLISLPLLAAQNAEEPDGFSAFDLAGALVWTIGFCFEAVADWQLARFKADRANEGKLMRSGLWTYTRHPNYFGEATIWWGYYLIAAGTTDGWVTVFSPVLMTVVLLWVSGVRLMERNLRETKPGYEEYVRSTSAFFPWFPARGR